MNRVRAIALVLAVVLFCNQCTFIGWGVGAAIPKRGAPMPADSAIVGTKIVVQADPQGPEVAKGVLVSRGPNGELVVAPRMPRGDQALLPNAMAFAPTPTTVVKRDRGSHWLEGLLVGAAVDVTVTALVVIATVIAYRNNGGIMFGYSD